MQNSKKKNLKEKKLLKVAFFKKQDRNSVQ